MERKRGHVIVFKIVWDRGLCGNNLPNDTKTRRAVQERTITREIICKVEK